MRKLLQKLSGLGGRDNTINLQSDQVNEDEYDEELEEELEDGNVGQLEEEEEEEEEWLEEDYEEGQLSIDVYQTPKDIVVKSTIAGVKPDDIDISINNDMLTIRGKRELTDNVKDENYLYRECYWGSFSRSIILPVEIEPDKIEACLENGVLTIILPKAKSAKEIMIKVKEK